MATIQEILSKLDAQTQATGQLTNAVAALVASATPQAQLDAVAAAIDANTAKIQDAITAATTPSV